MATVTQNASFEIKEIQPTRIGLLTKFYGIFNKTGGLILGQISYNSSVRQYILTPEARTIWTTENLNFISEFVTKLNTPIKEK